MKLSIKQIVFYIYMLVNCLTPIYGLQWTHLIAFVLIPLKRLKFLKFSILFLITWIVFFAIHLQGEINIIYYLRSTVMLFFTLFFSYVSIDTIKTGFKLEKVFKDFIRVNFIMVIIAGVLFFTPFKQLVWSVYNVSGSLLNFPRLSMLTYEPSYYSMTIVPIFTYAFLKMFNCFNNKNILNFILITIPLLLSFSLGIILCFVISLIVFYFIYLKRVLTNKRYRILLVSCFALLLIILLTPNNPIIIRINDIFNGVDTSAKGRVYESYLLAWEIIKDHNIFTGIGIGQIKEVGAPIIREYYLLPEDAPVQIPCSIAELLCMFGVIGVVLKISIIIFLFFKTKVIKNDFRFILFILIFVYQFTGSYILNVLEYMTWVLVFWGNFEEFNTIRSTNENSLYSKA